MLTQAEREEWFRSAVTQDFLRKLEDCREETKERWARNDFVDMTDRERSDRLNLYALATIDIVDQVINLVEENRPQPLKGEGE